MVVDAWDDDGGVSVSVSAGGRVCLLWTKDDMLIGYHEDLGCVWCGAGRCDCAQLRRCFVGILLLRLEYCYCVFGAVLCCIRKVG